MNNRPQTTVIYELEIITVEGDQKKEEFVVHYDSEFYDDDKESTDSIFITMRMAELKEKYGNDVLLLEYTVDREKQIVN